MKALRITALAVVLCLAMSVPSYALPIEAIMNAVFNSTNSTIQVEMTANSVTNDMAVGGDLSVTGDVSVGGAVIAPIQAIAAATYSIDLTVDALVYVVNYTDTGAVTVTLDTDIVADGRVIIIKDGELNANTNNITIATEGSETIDEAATYVMDADGESVTLVCDGTNFFVVGGYGE